jgi:hypothetical protein
LPKGKTEHKAPSNGIKYSLYGDVKLCIRPVIPHKSENTDLITVAVTVKTIDCLLNKELVCKTSTLRFRNDSFINISSKIFCPGASCDFSWIYHPRGHMLSGICIIPIDPG